MSIILRRQFVNYEPDEYELLGSKQITEVKSIFEEYPWEEQVEKHLELVESHAFPSLNLEHGNRELVITGYESNRFSIQFLYKKVINKSKLGYDLTHNDVLDLIEKFPVESTNGFLKILNKFKLIETTLLQKIFGAFGRGKKKIYSSKKGNTEYQYEFTRKRLVYMFGWSILYLILPLGIHIMVGNAFDLTVFIILQGFCTLIALPGIIITINHFKKNGQLSLHFSKGENRFIVVNNNDKYLFDKKEISKVFRFVSNSNNSPWNGYEYTVLKFKNESELWLSNILIKSEDLDNHISFVDMEFKKQWIPLLKKTVVNKH
ncbi:hypothetical protein [Mongoliibacter ruber]|uniref:PH domain-containing protein n=1 Tax=Mongoliibacter ruber TaxID=1750599 RepID=A0A2T0WH98_9BACT|nr:hypothetical protein [Mongoliibacter ruber]PRY85884.1 hypothetical protein CLW00_11014 [Mongoliibacter ruber]